MYAQKAYINQTLHRFSTLLLLSIFYLIFIKCKLTLTRIHCFLRINKPPKTKIKKKLIKICLVYLLLNSNLYILANILLKYFSIF